MDRPDDADVELDEGFYKIGLHGKVYRHNGIIWIRSGKPTEEIEKAIKREKEIRQHQPVKPPKPTETKTGRNSGNFAARIIRQLIRENLTKQQLCNILGMSDRSARTYLKGLMERREIHRAKEKVNRSTVYAIGSGLDISNLPWGAEGGLRAVKQSME